MKLVEVALKGLRRIYREGYRYQKAGGMLSDIRPAGIVQGELLAPELTKQSSAKSKLMETLDQINRKMGKGTLKIVREGTLQHWQMKRGNVSPAYTSRWSELPVVR